MKVIVFGSRTWTDRAAVDLRFAGLPPDTTIVHGASPGGGADAIADHYARAWGFTVIPVPINDADRRVARTRRQVPIMRNIRMATLHADADLAIGFWDGQSPGSRHMKGECESHGIPVEIIAPQVAA